MCDEIAIVGVGCRFPGAKNLQDFWKVLVNGENHVREVDNDRWDFQSVYNPDVNADGKSYVNKAGLLDNINDWDNQLYGVSENEAKLVDPQHRLILDCCHMAMEDAGITRNYIDGSNTSVYIGAMNDDFKANSVDMSATDSGYLVTGIFRSIVSARVSYTYNLKGPCMVVDTACSSSLVAIHLACQSLLLKESKMSIAGGVNVLLDPEPFIALSKAHMLSPTGQCHTFTKDADGYARGEGCGIVILQRLEDALAEGNTIWGVIRTGTNQDGHMITPITAPSSIQQLELLKSVYCDREADRNAVQVIESHGTGTPIGDPTEVKALGSFFKDTDTAREIKIKIGSVKTNIGHLESAAGVAGLIKVLLMMKNETIVASLMYSEENRNQKLDFKGFNMLVPTMNMKWSLGGNQTRVSCVNSFGFGGSNAHLLVKQWLPAKTKNVTMHTKGTSCVTNLVVFSSLQKKGIVQNIKSFVQDVSNSTASLAEISMTSLCRRDHYKYRVSITASSKEELKKKCSHALQTVEHMVHQGHPRFVFVFCGVGTTWKGMCTELLHNDVFYSTVKLADKELQRYTGWSIIQRWESMADVFEPVLGHLSIFVCQLGIVAMWMKFGILPDIVVGQSVGEVAACFSAGIIDMNTAVRIIFHRSLELSACPCGSMMVVRNANIKEIKDFCQKVGSINIAVYISPKSCTVSGEKEGILALKRNLKGKPGVKVKILDVSYGYHSALVKEAGERLQNVLNDLSKQQNRTSLIPIISTVYGKAVDHSVFYNASYWKSNVIEPVLFHDAILEANGKYENTVFIEIGPSPVLKAHILDILGNQTNSVSIASVEKGREYSTMLQALGFVHERGSKVDFTLLFDNFREMQSSLIPRYVFNNKSFPVKRKTKTTKAHKLEKTVHNYIVLKDESDLENFMQIKVSPETTPYIYEHLVQNRVIIPGALYADVGFEIGKRLLDLPPDKLTVQYDLLSTVYVSDENEFKLEIKVKEVKHDSHVEYMFGVKWKDAVVCQGVVKASNLLKQQIVINIESLLPDLSDTVSSKHMYTWLEKFGFIYGRRLSVLGDGFIGVNRCLFDVSIQEDTLHELNFCVLHPSILDGMFQSTIALTMQTSRSEYAVTPNNQMLPIGMGSVTVASYLADISKTTKMQILTEKINDTQLETMVKSHFNVYLIDAYGVVLAQIKNFVLYAGRGHVKCCDNLRFSLVWKMMPEDISMTDPSFADALGKITIINANDEMKAALLSNQTQDTVLDFMAADCQTCEPNTSLCHRLRKSKHVIVFIDPNTFTDLGNSKRVIDVVSDNLKLMQKIIISLKEASEDLTELTLVTLGVHASHYPADYKRGTSLIGSEMWGFFRNIEVEFIYKKTTIVDIAFFNQPTTQTLLGLMANMQKGNVQTGREYCIYNKTLLMVELHAGTKRNPVPAFRNNVALPNIPTAPLTLCSVKRHFIDDPFFVYKECDMSSFNEPNDGSFIQVEVDEICIHDSKLYPATKLSALAKLDPISDEKGETGYEAMAIEILGKKCPKKPRSKAMYRGYKEAFVDTDVYVVCYPCIVSQVVLVPEECCIKLSDIQHYRPGLLSTALILWELLENVPCGCDVFVFHSNLSKQMQIIGNAILRKKNKKSILLKAEDTSIDTDLCQTTALVLQATDLQHKYTVLRRFKHIVSLPGCLSESIAKRLQDFDGVPVTTVDIQAILENKKKLQTMKTLSVLFRGTSTENGIELPNYKKVFGLPLETIALPRKLGTTKSKSISIVKVSKNMLFDKMASYIVVGGLTGVGWMIVELLAEMGAGVVITFGRRPCPVETLQDIALLQGKYRCKIIHSQIDVTDSVDVNKSFQSLNKEFVNHPLRGIFQGAGIVKSVPLQNMTSAHIDDVLRPKVQGTINLHNETKHLMLDYFVLLSSISSIIGTQAQSNYGAANSFLDAFANYRRQLGLQAQSINWGGISSGMAAVGKVAEELEHRGHILLKKEEFRSCFVHSLLTNETNVVYANLDVDILKKNFTNREMKTAGKKLIFLWENAFLSDKPELEIETRVFNKGSFQAADEQNQVAIVHTLLVEFLSSALPGNFDDLKLTDSFIDIGIDSMSSLTITNLIRNYFGVTIKTEVLFDPNSTILTVSSLIAYELGKK